MSQHRPTRAAVFSAGSWGTAIAKVLADAGTEVVLHARRGEVADAINEHHRNTAYWPDITLPPLVTATTNPAAALADADFLVLSVPAQTLTASLTTWTPHLRPETAIVSLMKGIEASTGRRASQIIAEVTAVPAGRIAVLSGPNLAREVILEQPAAATIACLDHNLARRLQKALHTRYFRPYTSTDVVGCEMGGASKNIIALAVGVAAGMGMGHTTAAMLITRGLAEIARLTAVLGGHPATLAGLAGAGDLVATCSSPFSRNRSFGADLGHGLTVAEAATAGRTAEGVASVEAILGIARTHGVTMPITEVVYDLLHETIAPDEAVSALMQRPAKSEF